MFVLLVMFFLLSFLLPPGSVAATTSFVWLPCTSAAVAPPCAPSCNFSVVSSGKLTLQTMSWNFLSCSRESIRAVVCCTSEFFVFHLIPPLVRCIGVHPWSLFWVSILFRRVLVSTFLLSFRIFHMILCWCLWLVPCFHSCWHVLRPGAWLEVVVAWSSASAPVVVLVSSVLNTKVLLCRHRRSSLLFLSMSALFRQNGIG